MMSKVRVSSSPSSSSGSPSLERMEARQAPAESPAPTKPSACRSLFGPVDHRELARELRRHRREQEEASRARWNFDFQRHRPLRGRYQWQALGGEALPDFYSRPPPRQQQLHREGGGEGGPETQHRREEDSAGHKSPGAQRKRPAAEDPLPPNKRANATTTEEAVSEGSTSPSSASSVEQTPKKSSPRRQRPT